MERVSPVCEVCNTPYLVCNGCKAFHQQCQCKGVFPRTIQMNETEFQLSITAPEEDSGVQFFERLKKEMNGKSEESVLQRDIILPPHIKEMLLDIYSLEDFDMNQGYIAIVDFIQIQDERTRDEIMKYAEEALAYLNPATRSFVRIGDKQND